MHLKSLELNGFKSFGKKSTLDFKTSITGIVGPNGSGKSNVAEAFRFVLGEQSLKSMRGKRGEDLIFNGSNDSSRSNRASVKLVFDNAHRLLNIDFDEVMIERVVFRDGVNEYFINGSKVRLKDVMELLSGAHIGSSGHHIISQGEADRILHANPKERREMIEDALGIKVYQYKKEESERRLLKTEENIKQVESLRREIAPHLRFLKKQVEKFEKAKEIREELIVGAREYFKRETDYIEFKKNKLREEKKVPEENLKNVELRINVLRKTIEENLKDKDIAPEIIAIEKDLRECRFKKDSLVHDLGRIEGEISFIDRSIEKEREQIKEVGNKMIPLREIEELFNDAEGVIVEAEKNLDQNSVKNLIQRIRSFFGSFVAKHRQSNSSGLIDSLVKERQILIERKEKISSELNDSKNLEKKLVDKYESIKIETERVKDETRDAEKEMFGQIAKQNEIHGLIDRLNIEEREVSFDDETLKSDIRDFSVVCGVEVMKFSDLRFDLESDRVLQRDRKKHIERLKIRLEEMGVSGGDEILKEYKETEERDLFLAREIEDLFKSSADLKNLIKELENKLNEEFRVGVQKINNEFNSFFSMMFGGGRAGLRLIKPERKQKKDEEVTEEDEGVEEGIDIDVSLPNKKIKGLMMLSGGERALTSIALLFAISQVNPPPFVILDETDAALDEANSRKYGDMIENLAKHSQLIVITHNRETMSRAGILYGVTMGKDSVSKLLSIAFESAVSVAK